MGLVSFVLDEALFFFILVGFGLGGLLFFRWGLFRNYEVKEMTTQLMFSGTFALSCGCFALVIFEVVDVMDKDSRIYSWRICLYFMLTNLLVVLPYYACYTIVTVYGLVHDVKRKVATCVVLVVLFLFGFLKLGSSFPVVRGNHGLLSIETGMSHVGVVGVFMMASLSGYGAASSPFEYLAYFQRTVDDRGVQEMEKHLRQTLERVAKNKKRLYAYRMEMRADGAKDNQSRGLTGRLWSAITGSPAHALTRNVNELSREVEALELTARELFLEINELRAAMKRANLSHTLKGKLYNLLGYPLSAYCAYKIFMASINIIFDRHAKTDPVTRGFELLFKVVSIDIDVQLWSQQISFLLVGVIIVASVRGLLKKGMELFHLYSSSFTSRIYILAMAQIMGMYFLSSVLLIRMNLPVQYRATISMVLGDIEFNFFHRWFDFIFIPSALVTVALYAIRVYGSSSRIESGGAWYPD